MQLRAILLGSASWSAAFLIATGAACAQTNADAASPAAATAPQGSDTASDRGEPVIIG
ncbi:hypothetical protein [Sphingobium sp. YC-XJ3]|uniref:hypothetical protein n=1 Tax=Sphingobium sp. YC-XJ3 TaxID=3024245 RepID=UPI00235DEAA0|nr:hypothetical protein [Sphingobium sp. YC-XJ3]WDA35398.1 hypothetical protein PO876_18320 [Sphingobium sp. YC-XJ3]